MALNYEVVRNYSFAPMEETVTEQAAILYALGCGYGAQPFDPQELRFVYEQDLLVAPTMPIVLCYPGMWLADPKTGSDWQRIVHGELRLTLHAPIPAGATVVSHTEVDDVIDKGEKGALVFLRRELRDKDSGTLYSTNIDTIFGRADGGFGGAEKAAPKLPPVPDRAPDHVVDMPTLPQAALIYRLSGDMNPLHADPAEAKRVGFDYPILHGRCSYSVVGHALLRALCDYDPARLKRMDARFSAPMYPGETIRTEIWQGPGSEVHFRASLLEREGVVVLNNGVAEIG